MLECTRRRQGGKSKGVEKEMKGFPDRSFGLFTSAGVLRRDADCRTHSSTRRVNLAFTDVNHDDRTVK